MHDAALPSAEQLIALEKFILERSGIVLLEHQREALPELLMRACATFDGISADQFLQRLTLENTRGDAFVFLMKAITIGESYFFRDEAQIALLRDVLLPKLIARKRAELHITQNKCLRIWSAGCSSGQEIYTVSILLQQLLHDYADWQLELIGTDINHDVLRAASAARFRDWSFRTTPPDILANCFTEPNAEGEREVLPGLRQPVRFHYLNLVDDAYPSSQTQTAGLDLIICRNVFIYFSAPTIANVLQRFAACLVPDGMLLLGVSDHVSWPMQSFEHIEALGSTYLRKRRPLDATPSAASQPPSSSLPPAPPTAPSAISDASLAEAIATLGLKNGGVAAKPRIVPPIAPPPAPLRAIPANDVEVTITQLADAGRYADALEHCRAALLQQPTHMRLHLLHGMLLLSTNAQIEAEAAFRRALFLDPQAIEAHIHLGRLLLQMSRRDAAIKCLKNAWQLAQKTDASLAKVLREELTLLGAKP